MKKNKKLHSLALVSAVMILFLILVSSTASAYVTETQISHNGTASSTAIYGNTIVWDDRRDGNFDIYAYDLSTQKETQITDNGSVQNYPEIYGDRIVWVDWRNGNYDIYAYDLSTSRETKITADGSNHVFPKIYVDRIVWHDNRNGNYDVYMYNLSTSTESQITTSASDQISPTIWNDRVVWNDNGNLYMYNISTQESTQITASGSVIDHDIYGNRIVWVDERNGTRNVYMGTISKDQPVLVLPLANFSTNTTSGYVPLLVQFNDSSENATSVKWDFGHGNNSEERNPVHKYSDPGTYTVNLTASNENGTDSKSATITVLEQPIIPVANFSVNTTEGFAPLTIQFTDLSTNATSVKWDFGDGNNSTDVNPMHTYSIAGNYTANLTVSNENGTDSKLATITVSEKPVPLVANFSASPTLGNAPLNVSFTDNSIGTPTVWNWNFGDGNTSTIQNLTHIYSKVGNYTVILTVSNAGGSNTATKTNYIKVTEPKPKPIAVFTASPTSGNVPLKVKFTDKSTGSPTSWSWDFGDGAYSTVKNPTYTYNEAGKYTVSLTVKNAAGTNTKTITNYITVKPAPVKPIADFSASPTSGKTPLKVQFTDKSTNSPTSWKWSFGDGKSSIQKNPSHTYSKAGKYTVALIATNAAGSSTLKKSNYINVVTVTKPVAAFSASPTSGKAPLSVQFIDNSTNNPTSWSWKFGDGDTSTTQSPLHKYTKKGTYSVSLTVKNTVGSNSITKSSYITVK